jgi:hypothetical protein
MSYPTVVVSTISSNGTGRAFGVGVMVGGILGGVGVDIGISVEVSAAADVPAELIGVIHIPIPINAIPITVEKILGKVDMAGITISFALIPPPNSPTSRATQPAIPSANDKVISMSSLLLFRTS